MEDPSCSLTANRTLAIEPLSKARKTNPCVPTSLRRDNDVSPEPLHPTEVPLARLTILHDLPLREVVRSGQDGY